MKLHFDSQNYNFPVRQLQITANKIRKFFKAWQMKFYTTL